MAVIASSSLVAAVFGAGSGYLSQRALASRQAKIDYDHAARTRLYEAIGPLRFQLLVACRDVVRRISGHTRNERWNLSPGDYYANSTIYRLLRPLAICALIEKQMNAADFLVDADSIKLLRFEIGAYRLLTNKDPVAYHGALDWGQQTQHVFRDNLRLAAGRLITTKDKDGRPLVMDYGEFRAAYPDPAADEALAPLAGIFVAAGDSLRNNPVFWVRLVGYAHACQRFIADTDSTDSFSNDPVKVSALLADLEDPYIPSNVPGQTAIYDRIIAQGL